MGHNCTLPKGHGGECKDETERCIYCDGPVRRVSVDLGDNSPAHAKCHKEACKF